MVIDTISKLDDYRSQKEALKAWKEEQKRILSDDLHQSIKSAMSKTIEDRINEIEQSLVRYIKSNLHNISTFYSYKRIVEFDHNDRSTEYYKRILGFEYFILSNGTVQKISALSEYIRPSFENHNLKKVDLKIHGVEVVSMYTEHYIDTEDYTKDEFLRKIGFLDTHFKKGKTGNCIIS